MKHLARIAIACMATLLGSGTQAQPTGAARTKNGKLSVLFLGDSFMGSGGGLHRHTEELLKASGQAPRFKAITYGGTHMGGHYNTPADLRELLEGGYSHAVFVAGCRPGRHPARRGMMDHYGAKVVDAARAAGVIPVMFMHQEANKSPPELNEAMIQYHTEFAERHGIPRAPCFPAWLAVLKERPDCPLWSPDGFHQSVHGCFLNASVLFTLFTGTSPEGNSYVPMEISPDDATLLKRVAWEVWKATPQEPAPAAAPSPLEITGVSATAGGDVRIAFSGPLHTKTLKQGSWNIPGAKIAEARLSDDARTLIFSTPGLQAGKYKLKLTGIESCLPDAKPLASETAEFAAIATGWRRADIGAVWRPGEFTEGEAVLSLKSYALGKVGSEPADEVFFVYRFLEGDGEITAHLKSIRENLLPYPYEVVGPKRNPSNPFRPDVTAVGAAGLMIRFNDSSTAPMFALTQQISSWGEGERACLTRKSPGQATDPARLSANVNGEVKPVWMKLTRRGGAFEGFTSEDGINWVSAGTQTIPGAPPRVPAGFFAYSGAFYAEATADFDQIQFK